MWKKVPVTNLLDDLYLKTNKDRFNNFTENSIEDKKEIKLNNHNYIKIKHLGAGSSSVDLIYHIELEQLLALKRFPCNKDRTLLDREKRNYERIDHPLITKYYGNGRMNKEEFILVEFIKGHSLSDIKKLELNEEDKIIMIYELLFTIKYLHNKEFIYRDLKPSNFIIDENKTIVLTDFDRMLTNEDEQITKNFNSVYFDPEISGTKQYSYEVDIYSLGLIIYFIVTENDPPDKPYLNNIFEEFEGTFFEIGKICEKCINLDRSFRPTIEDVINDFMKYYSKSIPYSILKKFVRFDSREMNYEQHNSQANQEYDFIKEEILFYMQSANQNYVLAQFNLGLIYYKGEYVERDINKAIHYLSLAANQNDVCAQFNLGLIYHKGDYVNRNINKAIHYYSLAANQNHIGAQLHLGSIYYDGEFVKIDINKAILYFSLAANQNCPEAQFKLGLIYNKGEYVGQDISKAIHYYSLAAKQNCPEAFHNLGYIYYKGKYVERNINKAIHYYSLAADQNDPKA